MMKRMIYIIAALLIMVSGVRASSFIDRFSLRLGSGGILAIGGNYSDTEKLSKVVNIGMGLNGGLRYKINEYVFIDVGYVFDWMSVKKDKRPFDYKEQHPAFNLQMFTLNGTFFLSSGYKIEPYLTLGGGICPWEFSQNAIWGEAWSAPGKPENSFSSTSIGLNIGLGVESYFFSKFFIFAEIKYHYIFARNIEKFGTDDFTEQDFLGLNIGLIYSFGEK